MAGRIQMSGRSSPNRWFAITARNRRRSARRALVGGGDDRVPSAVPSLTGSAAADVLRPLAVEQSARQAVAAVVSLELAGRDHPRQGGAHRAAGDAEQLGEGDERPRGQHRRMGAEQHRQRDRPGVERRDRARSARCHDFAHSDHEMVTSAVMAVVLPTCIAKIHARVVTCIATVTWSRPVPICPTCLPTERLNARGMPIRRCATTAPDPERPQCGRRGGDAGPVVRGRDRRRRGQHVVELSRRVRADDARARVPQHPRPRGGPPPAVHATAGPTTGSAGSCSPTRRIRRCSLYRRAHFAHHRDEMGPDEPDTALYAGYPIARRLVAPQADPRRAPGISAYKNFRALARGDASSADREALQILAVHVVMLGAVDRVHAPARVRGVDRLVDDAVEGVEPAAGDRRARRHDPSRDRRETTHVIRQSRLARYWMVPYNTGWHLAHHVDMGVPWTEPAAAARRARRQRLGHTRDRVPELPGVLARRVVGMRPDGPTA